MSTFLQLAEELVIIILAAKASGYISTRLGQPSVLGELVAGLILGPSLLDILHLPFIQSETLAQILHVLGELGVLMLMFLAGMELHIGELSSHHKVAMLTSLGGLLLTLVLGWGSGRLFGLSNGSSFLIGLALSATSVSVAAHTLMELKLLRTRVGLSLLGAAVVDDVLSLSVFSVLLAILSDTSGFASFIWVIARMMIFLVLAVVFGLWILPWLVRMSARLSISQGPLSMAIVVILVYGLASEVVGGLAAIIGAFLAGLMFSRTPEKAVIEHGMNSVAYGFLVPVFFINIGLSVNLRILALSDLLLIVTVTLTAILGKVLGAAVGARAGGLSGREAFQVSAGMVARGEVSLIIAAAGSGAALISDNVFLAIVTAVLCCTLVTPLLLRSVLNKKRQEPPFSDSKVENKV